MRCTHVALFMALLLCIASTASAVTILGTGTGTLIGGDLTDPENDGAADANTNYNATFNASVEPNFGPNEAAFNVFDNLVGGGDNKWCCDSPGSGPFDSGKGTNGQWVSATFSQAYVLTRFTLTSGNDSPERRATNFFIQGTNDAVSLVAAGTATYTDIYAHANGQVDNIWSNFDEVARFDGAGVDFATPAGYTTFRYLVTNVAGGTGQLHQLNEFELFGNPVPEPSTVVLLGLGAVGLIASRMRRRK